MLEAGLYARLRTYFNQSDMTLDVALDRTYFPDAVEAETKKLVTPRERYDHLKEKNPLIDKFIDQMDLKLDE